MISPEKLYNSLLKRNVSFFTGVPDSLLQDFCAYVDDKTILGNHVIAANEGNAVALGIGHYLATTNIPLVYMQNSGLGNSINPITSLADAEVYRIPMLLMIGWRGEPGVKDEPQHIKQGRITPKQLELLDIAYKILEKGSDIECMLDELFCCLRKNQSPVAILVRQGTFEGYKSQREIFPLSSMYREHALETILSLADSGDLIISSTGKISREVFEIRSAKKQNQRDFLTVGGMGHTSSIALGVALGQPKRRIICLDGDGSVLMHLGAMAINGSLKLSNLVHVVLNNAAHESVGGQPTVADRIDFAKLSISMGYLSYFSVSNVDELKDKWSIAIDSLGPVFIEVRITKGSRPNLGRPTSSPEENKQAFMNYLIGD